jgi:hypothetical protein
MFGTTGVSVFFVYWTFSIILEADPSAVCQRVALRADDIPIGEQTVAQVSPWTIINLRHREGVNEEEVGLIIIILVWNRFSRLLKNSSSGVC